MLDLAAENKTFLDAILAPPILNGVGKTSANIFVDGNNSRVSFLAVISTEYNCQLYTYSMVAKDQLGDLAIFCTQFADYSTPITKLPIERIAFLME